MLAQQNIIRTLLMINILLIVALTIVLVKEKYILRIYNKIFPKTQNVKQQEKPYNYLDNTSYLDYTTVYPLYKSQKNIVMLGNSLTDYADWSELLGRTDVANRGIGGDITAGYLGRLNWVIVLKPKICFIDGGINDLGHSVNQDTIIKNLSYIIDVLKINNIKSVLTTVTLVSERCTWCANPIEQNKKVKELNKKILRLSKEKAINIIDLNKYVSNGNFLNLEYAVKDGLHFTGKTYLIWKCEVEKILKKEGI